MATTMTVAEIQQASAMIAAGNLAGFYGYMADQGYNYALLAGGLVTGGSFSGEAAVNYLIGSAQAQGVTITPDKLTAIETDMANKWVDALESAAQASSTGTVDGDLTYAQTLAFHTQVFSDFGLGPQTWTLYTPGQVLSPDYMQSSWESMLSQLATPVTGPMLSEIQLTTDMIEAASNSLNPQSAQVALSWLSANAFNVGSDFTAVFEAATPSAQISQVVNGGVQYSEGAGITLTQYESSSSVNGAPSYSVTKDVWTLPVTSPTISVTDISNGVVVNASTNADVSISSQGVVTVANSNNNIAAGAGATVVVNSADSNTIEDTSTGQDLTISNGTINLAGISGPVSAGVTDTVIVNSNGAFNVGVQNGSGTQTDYDVFNTTGYLTQDQQFQNGYVYDARNFTDGTLTDVAFYNPSQQITQDQIYTGGASGYVSSAVDYSDGVKTNQAFYNPSEQLTSNNVFNTGGQETDTQYFTGTAGNDVETNQVNYNVANGAEASNYQFNTGGQQTDTQFFTGTATNDYETNQVNFSTLNGVETSNFQYNAAGQETDAQVFTGTTGNDIETNQINYNVANGAEASNYQFNTSGQQTDTQFFTGTTTNDYETNQINYSTLNGVETANLQFNSAGQETDVQDFTGTAGNDIETNQVNYNVADGAVASNYQFNTSGQQTDTQFFTGTATNDYETNQVNYSTLNGVETANLQFNTAGQETDVQDFTGTAGNDIETNQVNYNVADGAVASNYQFNTSGQQTDTQFFTGTATNDYETNQVNYSATNGWETSNVQFNASGQETDQQNFVGTAGSDYETSQTNFSVSNGAETSNIVFNAQGQETQLDQYAGTSSNNYLDQMDVFTPGATYASQIDSYALNGLETMQEQFNQTSGRETGYTVFSGTDSDLETGNVQFGSTGNYASEIQLFNSAGKETEDELFNTSTGAVNMVSLFNGVNPYADEEEISSGGQYFSQIENFNPVTGQQTGGAEFNSQTGVQTAYFDNGSWYAGDPDDQTDPLDSLFGDDGMSGDDDGGDDGGDGGDDGGDDPIILNLTGGAVQTRSAANSHVSFDMQNNGQKVQTGWGTAAEGYLVYDPNDPGNKTIVSQENQLVTGMGALQSLAQRTDGTASGTLTASDALWSSLKVWVDTAGTGQFHSGELVSLSQLGITSLNLDGRQVNQNSNGNQIVADSTFTWANGRTGNMAGVNLAFNGGGATGTSAPLTASLVDQQAHLLISSMAAYGASPAASSDHVTAVPDLSHHMLAASSH